MKNRWMLLGSVLCLLIGLTGLAVAQEGQDQEAMMKAYMEMMKPGPPHDLLAKMSGEWTYTMISYENPEAPMTMTGESTKKMIMEGRYLQEDVSGSMMGMPFNGVGITGYDNMSKKYQGTWYDSMSTMMTMSHGEYAKGNSITMHTEQPDPATGQSLKVKTVTEIVDENKHVFTWFVMKEGKEVKYMEIEYVRK